MPTMKQLITSTIDIHHLYFISIKQPSLIYLSPIKQNPNSPTQHTFNFNLSNVHTKPKSIWVLYLTLHKRKPFNQHNHCLILHPRFLIHKNCPKSKG